MTLKRLFVITGDASGDVHGSHVIRKLRETAPDVEIQAVGGSEIEKTGIPLLHRQEKMGALGAGIFKAIPSHYLLGKRLLAHFRTWRPDAVLLIDYGMFNLWIAKQLKSLGIRVFYYIPPQLWASRPGRIKAIQQAVERVFCIFPFEKALYESAGVAVTFVGHPITEQLPPAPDRHDFCARHNLDPNQPIIGIFPGSRRSEVRGLLSALLQALPVIRQQSGQPLQFVIAQSPAIPDELFDRIFRENATVLESIPCRVVKQSNYAVLSLSRVILAASGTVTLEAALYGVPSVIAYPLSDFALWCFRRLASVRYIGLPNLLVDKPHQGFLPELLGRQVTPQNLADAIQPYLSDTDTYRNARAHLENIRHALGERQSASHNVALGLLKAFGSG